MLSSQTQTRAAQPPHIIYMVCISIHPPRLEEVHLEEAHKEHLHVARK